MMHDLPFSTLETASRRMLRSPDHPPALSLVLSFVCFVFRLLCLPFAFSVRLTLLFFPVSLPCFPGSQEFRNNFWMEPRAAPLAPS